MSSNQQQQPIAQSASTPATPTNSNPLIPKTLDIKLDQNSSPLRDRDLLQNWTEFWNVLSRNTHWKTLTGYARRITINDNKVEVRIMHSSWGSGYKTSPYRCNTPEEALAKTQAAVNILLQLGFKLSPISKSRNAHPGNVHLYWGHPSLGLVKRNIPALARAIEEDEDVKKIYRKWSDRYEFDCSGQLWIFYLEYFRQKKDGESVSQKETKKETDISVKPDKEESVDGEAKDLRVNGEEEGKVDE
ncbi:hypothetical protein B0T20DRAFT_404678 [Sordaria brevicollis]|uniref:Uncharacterized protein n=1 Tax=Sordaria brevicollis TaxID=83679 RepID=A0AAE0UDU7_SORBR|nr:hypothetical protein B0T20DRAFT_404678 [Sordaria brevicollis]